MAERRAEHMVARAHRHAGFIVVMTMICAACGSGGAPATPEPSRTPAGTTSATASQTPRESLTPSPGPPKAPGSESTPQGPVSSATPHAGYAQSCARDVPWGRQVTQPFLCLDGPAPGTHIPRGGRVAVQGYAGGSFENNVVVEVRALVDRTPGAILAMTPLTYTAPDIGMPGEWQTTLVVPAGAPTGPTRVIAHFNSPRDGSVVAQASVDIVVD